MLIHHLKIYPTAIKRSGDIEEIQVNYLILVAVCLVIIETEAVYLHAIL